MYKVKNIIFNSIIRQKISGLKLGVLKGEKFIIRKNSELVSKMIQELELYIKQKFEDMPPSSNEIVSNVRRMYRLIGWEPTKYRPSSEALIRRILKGIPLYNINNIVDLGNVTSARFHLPMGLYDSEKIVGDITIDVGKEGETYQGISKELIHGANKLILRDNGGIFGNPTADSKRTCLTNNTNCILAIFFTPPEVQDLYLKKTLDFLGSLYLQECPSSEIIQEIHTTDS